MMRTSALLVLAFSGTVAAQSPATKAIWLDQPKPAAWNTPGAAVPAAPKSAQPADPRCRKLARPAESPEDKRVQEKGWDLVGAYHGGWRTVVIRAASAYDGMCRPLQYQDFVFARGAFVGTLAPRAMDSRTDGALSRVSLQSDRQLLAEYARYAAADALCCPSKTATVVFEVTDGAVRPVSVSTSAAR